MTSAYTEETSKPLSAQHSGGEKAVAYVEVNILGRWAGARNLDRFSVRPIYSPIAIPSSSWINSGLESQFRSQALDRGGIQTSSTVPRIARSRAGRGTTANGGLVGVSGSTAGRGTTDSGGLVGGSSGSTAGRRARRSRDVGSIIDRLLQSPKLGGRDWATFSRTVEVLDSDGGSGDPRRFILLRIAGREGKLDRRVVDRESSLNVLNQSLEIKV